MKKFFLGLTCGIALTATTAASASDTIQAYLFPAKIEINGQSKELPSEYKVLNYNGHAYVPIRFIGESLGLGVRYIERDNVISIMNQPTNVDEVTKKVWLIQYRLNVGNEQKYVKELLGQPSAERTNDDKQQAVWRYDISPIDSYQYNGLNIDLKGIEQGKVGAQLIVNWSNEGKVNKIELWYKDTKSGLIVTHYVYSDGSSAGAIYE
jgi:hypothetical protein